MIDKPNLASPNAALAPDLTDYPVREYVASMAAELAVMAHEDGDGLLAQTLELAVRLAQRKA